MAIQLDKKKYRHEFKYFAPEHVLSYLEKRCDALLERDNHTGPDGFYNIKSLYFDDIYDTCYFENENGTDPREKFRIRIYNNNPSRISLELKQKKQGMTLKTSCPISLERVNVIIGGGKPDIKNEDSFLYKKFYSQILSRNLHPVTVVVYDRIPYVYKNGNVRITFDRNIRSGMDFKKFFDSDLPVRPVLPSSSNLLEVKFDEFLPDYIYEILQTGRLAQTSFSKYYLCRKFNMRSTVR